LSVASQQPPAQQQQPVIIQQPAPTQAPPVVITQPAPQTVVVPAPNTTAPSTSAPDTASSRASDDLTIQTNVDKKLKDDPTFGKLDVTALVLDGKVTLSGTVATPELKQQAERLVKSVRGVQAVDNQIIVSGGAD
jgi:hypothetical protein